ncbi:MAG: hypothetical protein Kow00104_00080 [Rhodothalassiaceae bacterium]
MGSGFQAPLFFSLLAAAVSGSGLLVASRAGARARENSALLAALAAGILLAAALLQLLPEGYDGNAHAPAFALIGYLALHALGLAFTRPDHVSHQERRAIALIPVIGIAIHSTLDGVVYGVSLGDGDGEGVLAIFGLLLHEFPEGAIAFGLLLRGGFEKGRALLIAAFASALTTPLGLLLVLPLLGTIEPGSLAAMKAFAAGALIYVAAAHLMPHVEHEKRRGSGYAFLLGILVAWATLLLHRL